MAYEDMIYNEKYNEVEREFRKVVDDVMRQELELLQVFFKITNNLFNLFINIKTNFRMPPVKKPKKVIKKLDVPARREKRKRKKT